MEWHSFICTQTVKWNATHVGIEMLARFGMCLGLTHFEELEPLTPETGGTGATGGNGIVCGASR